MLFTRYLIVGGAATVMHYSFLLATVELHLLLPATAAGVGAFLGALFAYWGNRRFTFDSKREHRSAMPRFLVVAMFGALLNAGLVWLGSMKLGCHYFLSQVIATMTVLLLTFSINRRWSFA